MATLFIADLHLEAARPATAETFLRLLRGEGRRAEALYILGDLFEAWVGDDDDDPFHRRIVAALHELSVTGVPVAVARGNRDFLLGERFARDSGCELLPDERVIDLYGTPTLLLHGDTLCTDDTAYQAFRAQVRAPEWQAALLARPLAERRAMAADLRSRSAAALTEKAEEIMDVTQATVEAVMRAHDVRQMIHGHTHRPAIHDFELGGEPARRIVLGAWHEHGSVLVCEPAGCRLVSLPVAD